MGSCGNTTLVDETFREDAASEQHSCSESIGNLVSQRRDCVVIVSNGHGDCVGEPGEDENTVCDTSEDIDSRDGIEGEVRNVGMKELVGEECCDSVYCLKEKQGVNGDDSCIKVLMGDTCGGRVVCMENNEVEHVRDTVSEELEGEKCGDSMLFLEKNFGESMDGSGLEKLDGGRCDDSVLCMEQNYGETVDGSGSKKLVGDKSGDDAVYPNENQGEKFAGSFREELMGDGCNGSIVCSNEIPSENVDSAGSKELIGDNDGDCMVCLNENQVEMDDFGTTKIMDDRCDDTAVCLKDNEGENIDASGPGQLMGSGDILCYSNENEVENVDPSGLKGLTGAKIGDGEVCLNDNQCYIDVRILETDRLCLEYRGSTDDNDPPAMDEPLGLVQGENTACLSSGMESSRRCEVEMKGDDQSENIDGSGPRALMGNGDSTCYSIENQGENVDPSRTKELVGGGNGDDLGFLNENQCNTNVQGPSAMDEPLGLGQDKNTACLSSRMECSTKHEDEMKGDNENVDNGGVCLTENQHKVYHHKSECDASQDCEMLSELKAVNTSPRTRVKEGNRKDDVSVSGSVLPGTKAETFSEVTNSCCLKGNSFESGANCFCDKAAFLSCQPFDVAESVSCGRLDLPSVLANDACAVIRSGSSIDCSGQRENDGKDVSKAFGVSESKHHPTASFSSQRGSQQLRSSRKTPAKRVGKNRRSRKLPQPHGGIEFLFNASRKKRSCSSKPARSSLWGLFSNIPQFLELHDDPGCNELQNQEPSRAGGGLGSGKRIKNRAGQNRKGSNGLGKTLTSCLRFKIKVGKEVAPSNMNNLGAGVGDPSVCIGTSSIHGMEVSLQVPKLASVVEDKVRELGSERQFQSENQEKVNICSDASIIDLKLANKVAGGAENLEKSAEDAGNVYLVSQSEAVAEASGEAVENKYMDPGTSPDSEVINPVPDAQVGLIRHEESHDTVLDISGGLASPVDVKSSKGNKRGKKEHRSSCAASIRKSKSSKKPRDRAKTTFTGFVSNNATTSSSGANSSGENGLGISEESVKVNINVDAKECCSPDVPDAKNPKKSASSKNKRNQSSKSSKSRGASEGKSRVSDLESRRKGNACKRRGDVSKSVRQRKSKEKGSNEEIVVAGGKQPLTGIHISVDIKNFNTGNNIASGDMTNVDLVSDGVIEQHMQPDDAWVRCDDCHKWRRIPVELVKSIDDACRWICHNNVDKAFADCSIPQEKSNAEINAELGISDAEEDGCDGLNYKELEKGFGSNRMTGPSSSHFWRTDGNQFLHRGRKTQTIDEIMVCHCKRPPDGKLGCGDECLNRILNIECVQGTCPCGDLCSNQQFQKRKYAKMIWDRFGKKGFGLRTLENIAAGQFLIEYVGEVLDMQAYEARQKEYASRGQRHFYFMTLNGSEVIDACVKGNLGRFINHSCDPNCRTEKWMVNGEICIGLFALRDIKKGEEVTFDYNYVRVFGAAAKKCHCGSPHCRGYIGGDPLSTEVIVHDDSDEEYPEPMMLEDGETLKGSTIISRSSSFDGAEKQSLESVITDGVMKENMPESDHSASATSKMKSTVESEDLKREFQLAGLQEVLLPMTVPCETVQEDDIKEQKSIEKTSCSIQELDTSPNLSNKKLPSDTVDADKKSKFSTAEDKVLSKSGPLMKTARSSSSIKKGKVSTSSLNGNKMQITSNKSQVPSVKPKKFSENSSTCRFETVEEKLNELLDSGGGITKRKDASKGYLKLLLLTATSGDNGNSEAIHSNRELSMILDALLKTKSRFVLTDIINKNGLQMLHNIMKKYRMDFKKIPILRKLLKVLEYLAERKILMPEHINGGPYCAGRESFRESILSFTEHEDKQVHQIARSFRDKWIPKHVRKIGYRDKDDGRMDFHRGLDCNRVSALHNSWRDQAIRPTEAISCITQSQSAATTSVDTSAREGYSSSSTGVCQTNGTKIRKRKSRWDQPAETEKVDSRSSKKLECRPLPVLVQPTADPVDRITSWDKECRDHGFKGDAINIDSGRQSVPEDVPPGFSSPSNESLFSSAAPTATDVSQSKCPDVIIAHPQKRFISRLPVSYGIPLPILQQFGTPKGERGWEIAPGVPFHPFPPLPPFPRDEPDTSLACGANTIGKDEVAKGGQQDSCRAATGYPDVNIPSAHGGNCHSETDIPGTNIPQTYKRTRESSYDLGKRYFRQQKRKGPSWDRFECDGNKNIGETRCMDVGNVKNELTNSYYTDDITYRVGEDCNDFYQQQHPNQH